MYIFTPKYVHFFGVSEWKVKGFGWMRCEMRVHWLQAALVRSVCNCSFILAAPFIVTLRWMSGLTSIILITFIPWYLDTATLVSTGSWIYCPQAYLIKPLLLFWGLQIAFVFCEIRFCHSPDSITPSPESGWADRIQSGPDPDLTQSGSFAQRRRSRHHNPFFSNGGES